MPPVVILGAGFAGCSTAWALARRGVRAVILERERELGRYASGRGAGLGRRLCEDDTTSALAIRGADFLRTTPAWSPTGGVLTFADPTRARDYIARADRLAVDHTIIDRSAVLALWPQLASLEITSAIHIPDDGVIDAMSLLHFFSTGLDIRFDTPATRVDEGRVETPNGPLDAKVIVDASGAWAGRLTNDPPLDSYKRHLFVVEAVPTRDAPYIWHLGPDEIYMRADGSHTLVSPCDAEVTTPTDQQPSPDADALLKLPLPVIKRWACQRAFAPDRLMRLGRDAERPWLVWAAALGGHGATASPAVGEVVADAVMAAL